MGRKAHTRIVVRRFEHQFSPRDRRRVQALLDGFDGLLPAKHEYRYQIRELQGCLTVGLLLAALHVAASMLERFLRDLLVAREIKGRRRGDDVLSLRTLRRIIEDEIDRGTARDLYGLAGRLRGRPLRKRDVKAIKDFYYSVRVPLLHGQIRRFAYGPPTKNDDSLEALLQDLTHVPHAFEEAVEDRALEHLECVLYIMRTYQLYMPEGDL